jgi:hypothetical protein
MLIGHYAVALAAKKVAPKTSLGTLVISAQFLDLLFPILVLLGLEHVRPDPGNTAFTPYDFYDYPISHSLITSIAWSIAFGLIYFAIRRDRKGSWVLGICVLSHWILDAISHRPDVPIAPGLSAYVGLGLWNSIPATVVVEGAMFVVGVILYIRATVAKDRTGTYAFWALIAFLALIYAGNAISREPASESAMGIIGLAALIIIFWAYWSDRHRSVAVFAEPPDQNVQRSSA